VTLFLSHPPRLAVRVGMLWSKRWRRPATTVLVGCLAFGQPATALAWPEGFARAAVGAGAMLSDDQRNLLQFDAAAIGASGHAGLRVASWLQVQGGVHFVMVGSSAGYIDAGKVLAPVAGLRASRRLAGLLGYVTLDGGPAKTGDLLRPFVGAQIGVDLRVAKLFSVGPCVCFGHVFQHTGPAYTTGASYLWGGLAFQLGEDWVAPPPPPPPPPSRLAPAELPTPRVVSSTATADAELFELIERAAPGRVNREELLAPVLFSLGSAELTAQGKAMLHEVARVLSERTDLTRIRIEGYADVRGDASSNHFLSLRRAARVQSFLVERGIASERLEVAAHGEDDPVEPGSTAENFEQNRRVVFRVVQEKTP
jgi:outer membrane protein OmpA-like peptidoglycan-associated protein